MLLKIFKHNFVEILGLSIFIIIVYSLFINWFLSFLGVADPLSLKYIFPCYLFLAIPAIKLGAIVRGWFYESSSSWLLKSFFLVNVIASISGVFFLDNTGNEILALISVATVCIIFSICLFFPNISESNLKLSLYSSSISLIFANCLRSAYLVGWDIHQEYFVFGNVLKNNFWDINTFRDAYNACLSITIFPTIVHNLAGVDPMIIFKVLMPMLFGIIPIIVYQIGTKILANKLAYAGAFSFLIQSQFMSQLPALLRQGVAFIFFALMIDSLLDKKSSQKTKNILFVVFGIGMILSHYSTTYVALAIFLMAKAIGVIFNKFWPCQEKSGPLAYWMILVLFVVTYLWNVLITNTAGGLTNTFAKVIQNIGTTFSLENKSDMVKGIFYQQSSNTVAVNDYSTKTIESSSNPDLFDQYRLTPVSLDTGLPMQISSPIPLYFHVIIPWLFRLFIIVGFFVVSVDLFKVRTNPLVVSLSLSMFIITFCIILLPNVSENYNFERLFQQMLILLSPVSASGFYFVFSKFKNINYAIPLSLIIISYLVQTTGMIDHILYGKSYWIFDNQGEQYFRYFSTKGEVVSLDWLKKSAVDKPLLYADRYTKLRLKAYSDQKFSYISGQINPPVIEKYGYILSGSAGTVANVVFADADSQSMRYNFPGEFMKDTRNNIYSNNKTYIYR